MFLNNRLICDCCGRQIVAVRVDDNYCIGDGTGKSYCIDKDTHCCFSCYPTYLEWYNMNIGGRT